MDNGKHRLVNAYRYSPSRLVIGSFWLLFGCSLYIGMYYLRFALLHSMIFLGLACKMGVEHFKRRKALIPKGRVVLTEDSIIAPVSTWLKLTEEEIYFIDITYLGIASGKGGVIISISTALKHLKLYQSHLKPAEMLEIYNFVADKVKAPGIKSLPNGS